ncbi:RMD5-like protein [Nosema bombycis CQ1]|uniref:RMD5-like protein n=1 Tax=Nosema bombycis (strain CQ1 / CVCC 102059) TaxID=578461 RepID=R0M2F2_NOSB1|nr:RMD5-like protein [Nosema bombycis CQ1]|eukprot:EOB12219.1 RMD5-like protein [Nosema bombycis CQ1]
MINEIQNKITHFLNEIKEGKFLKENKSKLISSWKSLEKPDPPSESDVLLFSKKNYKNTNQTVLFLLIHYLEKKGIELKGFLKEISKCIEENDKGGYMSEMVEYDYNGDECNKNDYNETEGSNDNDYNQPTVPPSTPLNINTDILCFIKNCINDHLDFKNIINDLNNKDYSSLDLFIKNNPVDIPLKFYFSILFFLNSESPLDQISILLRNVSPLMHEMHKNEKREVNEIRSHKYDRNNHFDHDHDFTHKPHNNDFLFKECKKFLKFIIFKKDSKIKNQVDLNLKSLFINEFSRIKFYINNDFLNKILIVGQSSFNQLKGVNTLNLGENSEENILPIEIKLPKGYNYHSLFVCPVLKVLCGDDNPPVVLKCNHVISLQAADILSNFESHENFKCPYCPEMCNNKEIVRIEL